MPGHETDHTSNASSHHGETLDGAETLDGGDQRYDIPMDDLSKSKAQAHKVRPFSGGAKRGWGSLTTTRCSPTSRSSSSLARCPSLKPATIPSVFATRASLSSRRGRQSAPSTPRSGASSRPGTSPPTSWRSPVTGTRPRLGSSSVRRGDGL